MHLPGKGGPIQPLGYSLDCIPRCQTEARKLSLSKALFRACSNSIKAWLSSCESSTIFDELLAAISSRAICCHSLLGLLFEGTRDPSMTGLRRESVRPTHDAGRRPIYS